MTQHTVAQAVQAASLGSLLSPTHQGKCPKWREIKMAEIKFNKVCSE